MAEPAYLEISRRKKAEQLKKIPREWLLPAHFTPTSSTRSVFDIVQRCGLLSERERHITEAFDATALLEELKWARLTSVEVTTSFCKACAFLATNG